MPAAKKQQFPFGPLDLGFAAGLAELAGKAAGSLQSDNVLADDGSRLRRLDASALRSQPLSINFRRTDGSLGWSFFLFFFFRTGRFFFFLFGGEKKHIGFLDEVKILLSFFRSFWGG